MLQFDNCKVMQAHLSGGWRTSEHWLDFLIWSQRRMKHCSNCKSNPWLQPPRKSKPNLTVTFLWGVWLAQSNIAIVCNTSKETGHRGTSLCILRMWTVNCGPHIAYWVSTTWQTYSWRITDYSVGRFVSCFACADLIRSHEVAQGKNNSISSYHQANRTNQTFQTISESRGSPGLLLYNGCRHGLRTRVTPSVWQRHVFGSEEFVCLAEACVWFRGVCLSGRGMCLVQRSSVG